jgi:hypothetical protein
VLLLLLRARYRNSVSGWRTSFLVEHYALADWPAGYQPGVTRINDCPANTYRALRVIDATRGSSVLLFSRFYRSCLHALADLMCYCLHRIPNPVQSDFAKPGRETNTFTENAFADVVQRMYSMPM